MFETVALWIGGAVMAAGGVAIAAATWWLALHAAWTAARYFCDLNDLQKALEMVVRNRQEKPQRAEAGESK